MRTGAETKVGIITVLALGLIAGYAFYIREFRGAAATYSVCVVFGNARGLQRGDPVLMSGVKIGEVASVEIDPTSLKAQATLAISKKYELYSDYKIQIATTGLIQERFVEVIPSPPNPYAEKMTDGCWVDGVLQPGMAELMVAGAQVLDNLNRTTRALNAVLSDQQTLGRLGDALDSFARAADAASGLAATTSAIARDAQPEVTATLKKLRGAADDLDAMTAELRGRVVSSTMLSDLEQTIRHARRAAESAERVAGSLAGLTADEQVQQQLRETIAAAHEAAMSAKQASKDLEVFSSEVRKAAPVVPRVAREAEQIAGTAGAVRERLKPPEINAAFDVLYGTEADRWFSSGRLELQTQPNRFLRFGMDDIGEESTVNVQIGDRKGSRVFRYGLMRSRLGIGVDFNLPRRTTLSLDLFDPNNLRGDVLADIALIPGRGELSLLVGARDIGQEAVLVGGIRLKR